MSIAPKTIALSSTSPQIAPHPLGLEPRLIDNGLLHYEASMAGFAERYSRGTTSHSIHVWWARRPHSAMRALVFASLCRDTSEKSNRILSELPFDSPNAIEEARALLASQYTEKPRTLDMFGGGGTIPAEAANLGAETYSIDVNQLSVFIQKCNLVYSQAVLSKDVESLLLSCGKRVINRLADESTELFPLRKKGLVDFERSNPFAYIWTYSMECPDCKGKIFLAKRHWLSRKKSRNLAYVVKNENSNSFVEIKNCPDDYDFGSVWVGRTGSVQCPRCRAKHTGISIKDCKDEMVAIIRPAGRSGKEFIAPPDNALPLAETIEKIERETLAYLNAELPSTVLPRWSGIINPAVYGVETHADFMNRRQRAVLLLLIKALKDEYTSLLKSYSEETSRFIIGTLSSFIDQLVDWNCRLSMWIPQNEQTGRAFCGPGVSMLWDYTELDPVLKGPSNLWSKLDRIVSGAASIKNYPAAVNVQRAAAQELPFENNFFDAIVTDPPYYDNIYYSALADFFYAWKSILLKNIAPELFTDATTDSSRELVASKFRSLTADQAHIDYCRELKSALKEADRTLKPDGVFSFVYSHSALRGWEAIIQAYRATSFRVTSVQPLSIERKQRPRAMTSEAINTCITFVAHKSTENRQQAGLDVLKAKLREYMNEFSPQLLAVNWSKEDTALAVFANAVAMLINVEKVSDADDYEAMRGLEQVVKESFPTFSVKDRKSL